MSIRLFCVMGPRVAKHKAIGKRDRALSVDLICEGSKMPSDHPFWCAARTKALRSRHGDILPLIYCWVSELDSLGGQYVPTLGIIFEA